LLLCSAPAFAQTIPDFSGVFLRNPVERHGVNKINTEFDDLLVLNIKQGVDTLEVTEMQNGAQATSVYNLNGKPSINVSPDGMRSNDRIEFKDGKLTIKSEVTDRKVVVFNRLTGETWRLSPDLQTLTIRVKEGYPRLGVQGFRPTQTYTRQTSLPVALKNANMASEMNKCNVLPPFLSKKGSPKLNHGAILGMTGFQQLAWQVSFGAVLDGNFFNDLERTPTSGGVKFRKKGMLISSYSGPINLEVIPTVTFTRGEFALTSTIMGLEPLPEWLLNLRFRIKWVGSESRDLGEVPAELRQKASDLAPLYEQYWLEIPAQDVPITDSLEVHILSADGNQLGCISGHI